MQENFSDVAYVDDIPWISVDKIFSKYPIILYVSCVEVTRNILIVGFGFQWNIIARNGLDFTRKKLFPTKLRSRIPGGLKILPPKQPEG